MTNESMPLDDLHSVEDLAAKYPHILSVPTLRWQLRSRDRNGLANCCVQLGKRLLISQSRYETWLASQAGRGATA